MDKRHREKNVCFLLTWIRDTTARVQSQDQKHYSMGVVSDCIRYTTARVQSPLTGQETLQYGCSHSKNAVPSDWTGNTTVWV